MPASSMRNLALLLVLALFSTSPASAGQFILQVAPKDSIELSKVKLSPEPPKYELSANGTVTYDLGDGVTWLRTNMSIDDPPEHRERFSMTLNLPYFLREDPKLPKLAAALVAPRISQEEIDMILREGHTQLSSVAGQVHLNRQTRNALRDLRGESHFPNGTDVKILSFFVITSKELVLTSFVEPDDEMNEAVALLRDILEKRPELFESEQARASAREAVRDFADANHTQLNAIVLAVSKDIAAKVNDTTCSRATALFEYFEGLSDNGRATVDPNSAFEVHNLSAVSLCLAKDLTADAPVAEERRLSSLELAERVAERLSKALPSYRASARPGDTRAENGSVSLRTLNDLIVYHRRRDL